MSILAPENVQVQCVGRNAFDVGRIARSAHHPFGEKEEILSLKQHRASNASRRVRPQCSTLAFRPATNPAALGSSP